MAVTQPGDVTFIAPLAVKNDAGPICRSESVQGGYVAIPSGNGPPTVTQIPLTMRRVGELAYTPGDAKFWQLIGGIADANWTLATFSGGGLTSFNGRTTAAAVPTAGDYTSTQITSSSFYLPGTVTDAIDQLSLEYLGNVVSLFGRTLALTDTGKLIVATGTQTISIPHSSTVPFSVNARVDVLAMPGAVITFAQSGATTVNIFRAEPLNTAASYNRYTLTFIGSSYTSGIDTWIVSESANPVADGSTLQGTGTFSIKPGGITDTHVNAAAAIAGTKIAPNFGSQNVTTTGTVQAAQFGDGTTGLAFNADSFATTHYNFKVGGTPVMQFTNGNFVSFSPTNYFGLNSTSSITISCGNSSATGTLPSLTVSAKDGNGFGTYTAGRLVLSGGIGATGTGTGGDVLLHPGAGVAAYGNVAIGDLPASFQAMQLGIFILNATAVPTGNPSGGGFLYVSSGALKYRGSSGTVTTIAPA
jgi:hypothetical protein